MTEGEIKLELEEMMTKYRAFYAGKMYEVAGLRFKGNGEVGMVEIKSHPLGCLEWRDTDTTPLMQFTGLTAKNGTEIFADDVLLTDEAGWRGKVVFRYGCYMLIGNHGGFSSEPSWSACEIIGNCHQHPELLENNDASQEANQDSDS